MEVQVSVDPDKRIGYSFRLSPRSDGELNYSLSKAAFAIGLSGWDFTNEESSFVGFDFDSVIGHVRGLTNERLLQMVQSLASVPWVTVVRSTSGRGFHVFAILSNIKGITSRRKHAAVAKLVLSKLSALTGLDLLADVDTCGHILWVWHKGKGVNGYEEIQRATETLSTLPEDLPRIEKARDYSFDSTELDKGHNDLLRYLEKSGANWWWDNEKKLLVCHTYNLLLAHKELKLNGRFDTIASGESGAASGRDHNCFCVPVEESGWIVRRFGAGTKEHESWGTDSNGYAIFYYNSVPSLSEAVRYNDGVEIGPGEYSFATKQSGEKCLREMGCSIDLPFNRGAIIKRKSGRLIITQERNKEDEQVDGWASKRTTWIRSVDYTKRERVSIPHDRIRHVIHNDMDSGWYCSDRGVWRKEPLTHVRSMLLYLGYNRGTVDNVLGKAVEQPWIITSIPFKEEYSTGRKWNRYAARFSHTPEKGEWETFKRVFDHCGKGLDEEVKEHYWCRLNSITTGGEYLFLWAAFLIQRPTESLPYLFFYGEQNTGKSTFHESLGLLFYRGIGYVQADAALVNHSGFNAELDGAVLCYIEETDLSKKKDRAYNRIKDWVTSPTISIHRKGGTPYTEENYTHWAQCGNSINDCPIIPGDTRITAVHVQVLREMQTREALFRSLRREVPHLLFALQNKELPPREGRLNLPIIETGEKEQKQESELNDVERFIKEQCHTVYGQKILFKEFHKEMIEKGYTELSRIMVGKLIPVRYPKGKWGGAGEMYIGNISFTPGPDGVPLKRVKDRLK